jgi:hypothetical protein
VLVKNTAQQSLLRRVVHHLLDQVLALIVQLHWPSGDGWLSEGAAQTNHAATNMRQSHLQVAAY